MLRGGKEGFYFAVADEVKWKDAAEAINKVGIEQGWLPKDSRAVSWTSKQVGALIPDQPVLSLYLFGSNSRAESARARLLGWKPRGPTFWKALPEDVEITVKRAQAAL